MAEDVKDDNAGAEEWNSAEFRVEDHGLIPTRRLGVYKRDPHRTRLFYAYVPKSAIRF